MNSLLPFLLGDAALVALGFFFAVTRCRLYHPLPVYLFCHFYSVTWRGWELYFGAAPMYAYTAFSVVSADEVERAVLWADAAFAAFFAATWLNTGRKIAQAVPGRRPELLLSYRLVFPVVALCLPTGLLFMWLYRSGEMTGGYAATTAQWPIACLGALIFLRGFKWYLVAPSVAYLLFVGLQGFHRFMVILPLVFFLFYYLQRKQLKWPSLRLMVPIILVLVLFPQLKDIGAAVQEGDTRSAVEHATSAFTGSDDSAGKRGQFLDQLAGALTLADAAGRTLYGSTYLALITLPIPRSLWPEKPGIGDHIIAIATEDRPYDREGRIITYIGESYINFGEFGIVAIAFLLGVLMTRWFERATSGTFPKVDRYVYTVFLTAFVQVFRDGLTSFVLFTIVPNIPLIFIILIHWLGPRRSAMQTPEPIRS